MRQINVCLFLLLIPQCFQAQVLYNPQTLYDAPGGIFDTDSLRTINLSFYDNNYHDSLTQSWFDETDKRLPATLQMGNLFLDSVAVRYKGNSTFYIASTNNIPKVPYNIDMNDFVSGQKLMDYKKLKLANALFDPTFAKEMTGYRLYRNYLPSPEANLMKLNVQGSYLGLFVNTESVGKQFLKKHFDEKDGTLFKCDPSAQYGSGATFLPSNLLWYGSDTSDYSGRYQLKSDALSGWFELVDLIDVLNNDLANIDTILNVDRVLWYFALNTVLANTDTYNSLVQHNYYLYRTEDGLFQIIPWDLSETFIGAMLDWVGNHNLIYQGSPYYGHNPIQSNMPMMYQLLSDPTYYKQYTHHLRTVYKEQIEDTTTVFNMASATQSLGFNAAQQDPWKLFTMSQYTYNLYDWFSYFTVDIAGIMRTVKERRNTLSTHPELLKVPPQINNVHQSDSVALAGDSIYITADITGATQVDLMVTISPYKSKFQAIAMVDDGTNGDAMAADGIYTALVPHYNAGDAVKYYVRAQNADAMDLSPARAEYEFYEYNISPTVSVTKIANEKFITVFPNPSSDWATITFSKGQILDLAVLDASGKVIFQQHNILDSNVSINCSEWAAGTYLLNIHTDKGAISKALTVQ